MDDLLGLGAAPAGDSLGSDLAGVMDILGSVTAPAAPAAPAATPAVPATPATPAAPAQAKHTTLNLNPRSHGSSRRGSIAERPRGLTDEKIREMVGARAGAEA